VNSKYTLSPSGLFCSANFQLRSTTNYPNPRAGHGMASIGSYVVVVLLSFVVVAVVAVVAVFVVVVVVVVSSFLSDGNTFFVFRIDLCCSWRTRSEVQHSV
jgi:hypothetical protein